MAGRISQPVGFMSKGLQLQTPPPGGSGAPACPENRTWIAKERGPTEHAISDCLGTDSAVVLKRPLPPLTVHRIDHPSLDPSTPHPWPGEPSRRGAETPNDSDTGMGMLYPPDHGHPDGGGRLVFPKPGTDAMAETGINRAANSIQRVLEPIFWRRATDVVPRDKEIMSRALDECKKKCKKILKKMKYYLFNSINYL